VAAGSSGQLFRAEYGVGVGVPVAVKEVFASLIDQASHAKPSRRLLATPLNIG